MIVLTNGWNVTVRPPAPTFSRRRQGDSIEDIHCTGRWHGPSSLKVDNLVQSGAGNTVRQHDVPLINSSKPMTFIQHTHIVYTQLASNWRSVPFSKTCPRPCEVTAWTQSRFRTFLMRLKYSGEHHVSRAWLSASVTDKKQNRRTIFVVGIRQQYRLPSSSSS